MTRLSKTDIEYQVLAAASYVKRGGDFEFWASGKSFEPADEQKIKSGVEIILDGKMAI